MHMRTGIQVATPLHSRLSPLCPTSALDSLILQLVPVPINPTLSSLLPLTQTSSIASWLSCWMMALNIKPPMFRWILIISPVTVYIKEVLRFAFQCGILLNLSNFKGSGHMYLSLPLADTLSKCFFLFPVVINTPSFRSHTHPFY